MDIEDLFKKKRYHKHNHDDDHDYKGKGHRYSGSRHGGNYKLEMIRSVFDSLPHKKALLIGAIIVAVLVLVVGIALLWMLLPLAAKLLGFVETNGVQGLLDYLLSLAQLFWKGNG